MQNDLPEQNNPEPTKVPSILNSQQPTTPEIDPNEPVPSVAYRIWMNLLQVISIFSICVVGLYYLLFLYLGNLAQNGVSGTEFIALILWPVLVTIPYLSVIGFITNAILTIVTRKKGFKIFWGILSLLLLLASIHQTVGYFAATKQSNEYHRVLGRDEMISLINDCSLSSFLKKSNDSDVTLQYKNNYDANGDWKWSPTNADGKYYDDYVRAAKSVSEKCGEISYSNLVEGQKNDPDSSGHQWISIDEAKSMLLDCTIKTYNYGPITLPENVEGTSSGIALIDYGFVKHLYVYPPYDSQLLPVVSQAKEKCGQYLPQIWNGSYE